MSQISCRISNCPSVFVTEELVSPNATYLCRLHTREEQVEACGRKFDADTDYIDHREHFQKVRMFTKEIKRVRKTSQWDKNKEWRLMEQLFRIAATGKRDFEDAEWDDILSEEDLIEEGPDFSDEDSDTWDTTVVGLNETVQDEADHPNAGYKIVERKSGIIDSLNWKDNVLAMKVLLDPNNLLTQEELKAKVKQNHMDYVRHILGGVPITEIAEEGKENPDAIGKRIQRSEKEIAMIKGKICPPGTCPRNACMHVEARDRDFVHFIFEMPQEERTKLLQAGGYYAFYKLKQQAYQLAPLDASTDEEAEAALVRLQDKSLSNAVERFSRADKDCARMALLVGQKSEEWKNSDAWDDFENRKDELIAEAGVEGMPEHLLEKFIEISEAFDQPGIIRHLDPDPSYTP